MKITFNLSNSEAIINAIATYLKSSTGMDVNHLKCIYGFGINYCWEFKYFQIVHGNIEIPVTIPGIGEIRITESLILEMEKQLPSDLIEALSEKALLNIYPELSAIIHDEYYKFMVNRVKDNIIEL